MQIIIDGQKIPVNVRVSKDLLVTLKSLTRTLNWGICYDIPKEIVYINSKSPSPPIIPLALFPNEDSESGRLQNKIICIDPGHGGSDPGAVGPSGTLEKDNTLPIAILLRDKLQKNGATVVMTRETDCSVAAPDASATEELSARVEIANDSGADIFVSIHNDAFTDSTAEGTTSYHYGDANSSRLAMLAQKNLVKGLGTKDRGSRFGSFYVIRHTDMPAILVEIAFISNPEEEILLSSVQGRATAADCIFEGITQYFRV